jgi:hypothetical protein
MRRLIDLDVNVILECGTTTSLSEMVRRDVPGSRLVLDPRDYARLFSGVG